MLGITLLRGSLLVLSQWYDVLFDLIAILSLSVYLLLAYKVKTHQGNIWSKGEGHKTYTVKFSDDNAVGAALPGLRVFSLANSHQRAPENPVGKGDLAAQRGGHDDRSIFCLAREYRVADRIRRAKERC